MKARRAGAGAAALALFLLAACGSPATTGRASGSTTTGPTAASSSAPPASTTSSTPARCVDTAAWPLAQQAAQLVMVSGQFDDLAASLPEARAGAGGFVLMGQPAAGTGSVIRQGLTALTTAGDGVPAWLATDEEGGDVARLSAVIGPLPSPRQLAATDSPAQVQALVTAHATAMRSLGITMDLAPVLDVAPASDTVADEDQRSFSDDPSVVTRYGAAFIAGLEQAGVVPVAKHFPGLGHATANTDLGPSTDPPLAQLQTDDLVPFTQAVAGKVPVVMVGHPQVPDLTDGRPASLAAATYALLRGTLHFSGVTLTDSLGAGAISAAGYAEPAAAVTAAEAGADMVMVDASAWSATVQALAAAVHSGALPASQVMASLARILAAKGMAACPS